MQEKPITTPLSVAMASTTTPSCTMPACTAAAEAAVQPTQDFTPDAADEAIMATTVQASMPTIVQTPTAALQAADNTIMATTIQASTSETMPTTAQTPTATLQFASSVVSGVFASASSAVSSVFDWVDGCSLLGVNVASNDLGCSLAEGETEIASIDSSAIQFTPEVVLVGHDK
jgi:hypothetical protein